jgi:hypothetical protein
MLSGLSFGFCCADANGGRAINALKKIARAKRKRTVCIMVQSNLSMKIAALRTGPLILGGMRVCQDKVAL